MARTGIAQAIKSSSPKKSGTMAGSISKKLNPTPGISYKKKPNPTYQKGTAGIWTDQIDYNPDTKELIVEFQDGFKCAYPNISKAMYSKIARGTTRKDGIPNSVGAALHKYIDIHNYRVLAEGDGSSRVITDDGEVLFDMHDY